MIKNDKKITLMNRSDMHYTLIGVPPYPSRTFEGYGKKVEVTFDELKAIANTKGGKVSLQQFITIDGEEEEVINVLKELDIYIEVEREYFYKADTIKTILQEGSLDLLEDTLNFAPKGVVDLIQTFAIKMPLTDMNKINLISKMLEIDLLGMIKREQKKKELEDQPVTKKERKVQPSEEDKEENSKPKRKAKKETIKAENQTDEI